ncbi:hypothetical protein AWH62_14525 [Maricaulis sp. W15]|uniref:DUF167 domain-containing protein n=1 Tax=Maricaulis sp. W15 TaxID=1772333 RepID=UPI000948914E|nr:DUF167 family protein [Maricaulis sp. W15]OLF80713.1 hypothetical protein AWH62_14525 [Maricaulis sp. W15]
MFDVGPDSVVLRVRLTPGASRDGIEAWRCDAAGQIHLAARVRAVPEKGRANTALIALLAKQLAIPKRDIDVIRGATSRLKTIRIAADRAERDRVVVQLEAFADERKPD